MPKILEDLDQRLKRWRPESLQVHRFSKGNSLKTHGFRVFFLSNLEGKAREIDENEQFESVCRRNAPQVRCLGISGSKRWSCRTSCSCACAARSICGPSPGLSSGRKWMKMALRSLKSIEKWPKTGRKWSKRARFSLPRHQWRPQVDV